MHLRPSSVVALLAVVAHTGQASPTPGSDRTCIQFDLPVTVTSQNALYGTPNIVSNIDVVEFALYSDTWSTLPAAQRIVQNITVSGTYSISAQFCTPKTKSNANKSEILQIATHGWAFDKRHD